MKVLAKPIQMVSWTDEEGNINPIRFRYSEADESYKVIKVDKVVHKAMEKLAGNHMLVYKCWSNIDGIQKLFELKYEISSHRWILFKI